VSGLINSTFICVYKHSTILNETLYISISSVVHLASQKSLSIPANLLQISSQTCVNVLNPGLSYIEDVCYHIKTCVSGQCL